MQTYRGRQFRSLFGRLWEQSLLSDEFVQSAVDLVARTLSTDVAGILAYDARANELLLVGTKGLARSGVGYVTLKMGQSMSGRAAQELRPVFTSDVRNEPTYVPAPTLDQDRFLSLLAVPILLGDRLVGALSVQTIDSRNFGARDIQELSEIAAELAPYLDELWRRDLASRLRGPSCLSHLEGFLANHPEPVEVAIQLAGQLQVAFPVRRPTVAMRAPDGSLNFYGDEPDDFARQSLQIASRSCGPKARVDDRLGITLPICAEQRSLGAVYLGLGDGSSEPLSSAAHQVLQSLVQLASGGLDRSPELASVEATAKEKAYEDLIQMVLDDAGFEPLMARVTQMCRGAVAVTDRLGGLVGGTMPETTITNLPLKAGTTVMGRMLAAAPIESTPQLAAAAQALAMELSKWNLRFEVESELRGDSLDALLSNTSDAAETSMRAHLLGLDSQRPYVTVAFNLDLELLAADRGSISLRSLLSSLERSFAGTDSVTFVRPHGLLVFVDRAKLRQPLASIAARALEALKASAAGLEISAGIGPQASGPHLYAQSIRQARLAADLAGQLGYREPVDASQIGAYGLLVGVEDIGRLQVFVDEYLGSLVEHDARRGTQFVRTLEAYHAAGERLRPAAEALFIHVNTLKHRLERIAEITGRDLEQVSERFNLYLALYAHRLVQPSGRSLLPSVLAAASETTA